MSKSPTRILLVAATEAELPLFDLSTLSNLSISTLSTGVGMVATTFSLTKELEKDQFDLVLNVGIAGSFSEEFEIGDTVQVYTDRLVELGAEDHDSFLPADEMKLIEREDLLFPTSLDVNGLRKASGVTVNRVHGNQESITKVKHQFAPDVESMEGAAVGFVCSKMNVKWVQIRSISNIVEPRNRASWDIPLALENLYEQVLVYLQRLNDEA